MLDLEIVVFIQSIPFYVRCLYLNFICFFCVCVQKTASIASISNALARHCGASDSGSVGCRSRKWRKLHLSSFTFPCFLNRLANVLCGPYNAARLGRYSPTQVSFNYFLFIFWFSFHSFLSAFNAHS